MGMGVVVTGSEAVRWEMCRLKKEAACSVASRFVCL
jgi:hypothetical protein